MMAFEVVENGHASSDEGWSVASDQLWRKSRWCIINPGAFLLG